MLFRRKKKKKEEDTYPRVPSMKSEEIMSVKMKVSVREVKGAPGVWDVVLKFVNDSDETKNVKATLSVEGEILESPPNIRLIERNKIMIDDMVLQPKQAIEFSGIKIFNTRKPTIYVEIEEEKN